RSGRKPGRSGAGRPSGRRRREGGAASLRHIAPRERRSDGSSHLLTALPRHFTPFVTLSPGSTEAPVRGVWSLTLCAVAACAAPPAAPAPLTDAQAEVTAMLARSAADWNRGDLAGFMSDYARDSLTSYVSGRHVQYGWHILHDHTSSDPKP